MTVRSVTDFGIGGADIGGTPQSVTLLSSDGRVCLGTLVSGVCTGQSLTKDTDLTLQGKTGVTAGALAVRSALVDSAQGALALGDVTVTDGKLALYGRTGITAGRLSQARTIIPPTAPNIDLLSSAGAISVGDVTGTGLMYGRAADGLTTGAITGVKDIDLRAGKALTTGAVTATGFVQLESLAGSMTTLGITAGAAKDGADTDPCKGKAICLRAGEGATSGTQSVTTGALTAGAGDILVRSRSAATLGAVTARDGTVLLSGRDGVAAGDISQARVGGPLTVPDVALAADSGAVAVGAVTSTGSIRADASTDITTAALTAGTGIGLVAGGGVTSGDIDAGGAVRLQSGSGSITAGGITARALPAASGNDPCDGNSICVRAGVGSSSGTQTVSAGALVATDGAVLVGGRSGVTLDSARADRGGIDIGSSSGAVTSGALTAGTGAAGDPDYTVKVEGTSLALQGVRASGDIRLAATAATGTLTTGLLDARRTLKMESVTSLGIRAADIGGAPETLDLSSSSGSVCIGALVAGVCTGQALSKNTTAVTLTGRTGVQTGALTAAGSGCGWPCHVSSKAASSAMPWPPCGCRRPSRS